MTEPVVRNRLFIGSLADDVSEDDLRVLFSGVGSVLEVSVIRDWNSGRSRGFGFVQMQDEVQAQQAIDALAGHELKGRHIRVMVAEPKGAASDKPGPVVEVVRRGPEQEPHAPLPGETAAPVKGAQDAKAVADTTGHTPEPAESDATPASPAVETAAQVFSVPPTVVLEPRRSLTLPLIAVAATLLVVALLVVWIQRVRQVEVDPHTVLVLPLDVVGQRDAVGYLGLSFSQAVAVNLAPASDLHVLPVPSPDDELLRRDAAGRARAATRLGAGRLLGGDIRRDADTIHVALTLVDPVENRLLWGIQKQGRDSEVLSLAAQLAQELAVQLGAQVPQRHAYITDLTGSPALQARPDFTEAVGALRRGEFGRALVATARLVEVEPTDSTALALRTHALTMTWDAEPSSANLDALKKSVEALERSGQGHPYIDFYRAFIVFKQGQAQAARDQWSRVLDAGNLAPAARAWLLRYRAVAKQVSGDVKGALEDLDESLRLDPTNAWTLGILSSALVDAQRLAEALTRAQQGLALAPSYWRSHQALAYALAALGRRDESAASYARACELGQVQLPCSLLVVTLQKADRGDEARTAAEAAEKLTATPLGLYNLACYWALAGDRSRALPLLKRALDAGLTYTPVRADPDLASLHGDAEFEALVPATAPPH
ncbi:MAG: hypothetical protein ABIJ09_05260 [Pseudomonadota bacterium]